MHTFHQFVAEKNEKNQVICHGRRIKDRKEENLHSSGYALCSTYLLICLDFCPII
jgi:hypothetical protein